jgi:hypothetical protein
VTLRGLCCFGFLLELGPALLLSVSSFWHAMGIQNLAKLIADRAPAAIKEGDMKSYWGRKIAIDA